LAIQTVLLSTAEVRVENSSTTTVVASKGSVSQSTSVHKTFGYETNTKDVDTHHVAKQKQLSVLKSTTSKDSYLRAIQEIYPGINTGWLSSNSTFYDNWAQVRATASLKAFTTVR
jgi:hypothetical protein